MNREALQGIYNSSTLSVFDLEYSSYFTVNRSTMSRSKKREKTSEKQRDT